jgi:2-keto-4-pentenoate hydratase/2-oxohepta-3-ene-1,7-dioic acid hydratase in catechol pathway
MAASYFVVKFGISLKRAFMKLVTFEVLTPVGRFQRLGALLGDKDYILDLNACYAWWLAKQGMDAARRLADAIIPATMRTFIEGGEHSLDEARKILAMVEENWSVSEAVRFKGSNGESLLFHRSNVKLLSPLPNPNSLRDFMAFEAHVKKGYERRGQQMPEQWYRMPVYYKGNHRSILGPDEPVVWPRFSEKLDYELEMACIIGKKGRDIAEPDAKSYIFGFAVLNDFSARDIQMEEMLCRMGPAKGKDFGTALGPYLVTADEVPDVRNLKMVARINGEIWSEGNSGTCHWTWEQMIAHVSNEEDLYPGDIFGSGTVGGGCGYELERWIKPGDIVELEIENLGKLRNPIVTHENLSRSIMEPEEKRVVPAS